MTVLEDRFAIVVGGAGFVGSNLVRELLRRGARHVLVVDNLLSAERENVPADDRVTFVEGSITDDAVLAGLPGETELIFHLATFHGNQSSIADPLADHENNTLTTLKLLERAKDLPQLEKIVYASAGCTVAEKTYEESAATNEDAPVSLWHDSPYQISKIIGEFYA
ncbi:MAG: UDP-glucose 4-epimerase, partial [Solirubrobacteraceae bacterium]|nr:UDP-glucose 4-epimerase [Solirubrobacteraceae bacterium]